MTRTTTAYDRADVEALIESARIATRGMEAMGQQAAAFAGASFEAGTAAWRALAGATSPAEFMRLQGDHARASLDAMVAEASRATEAALKLAGEVAAPIQNRVAIAVDRFHRAA